MQYNDEVFMIQFPIVKRFVYHLIYYRVLYKAYYNRNLKCEFWTHTIDAHLFQAASYWCMVFGSHGCNPTHWKNLTKRNSDELESSFRDGLQAKTGLNMAEWERYWKEMTEFRNEYAAHRELTFTKPIPNFDIALKIAYYYDHWIREIISPDIFDEPLLEKSVIKLRQKVVPIIDNLIKHNTEEFIKLGGEFFVTRQTRKVWAVWGSVCAGNPDARVVGIGRGVS